jgi:hypothetical protein
MTAITSDFSTLGQTIRALRSGRPATGADDSIARR